MSQHPTNAGKVVRKFSLPRESADDLDSLAELLERDRSWIVVRLIAMGLNRATINDETNGLSLDYRGAEEIGLR